MVNVSLKEKSIYKDSFGKDKKILSQVTQDLD